MNDFKEVLYESLLYSFGKILAEYNAFAQDTVLQDAGKEILDYLGRHGFPFVEEGTINDVEKLISFFEENGFAQVKVTQADLGSSFRWDNLYGIEAYSELLSVTENPFLSCPLNACIHHIASKHGKTLLLHSKSFDLETGIAYSQEEIIDREVEAGPGFNPLVIENTRLLEISEEQKTALEVALEEVNRLASTDYLTGLKNRRQFLLLAEQEFQSARRYDRNLSAIMLDLDQFKPINDSYGHAVGDEALIKVAECCSLTMRMVDVIGRYGGDEFAILLPESDIASACNAAERLRNSIAEQLLKTDIGEVSFSASLGVVALTKEHDTLAALLRDADNALYTAKRNGRNSIFCS